MLRIGSFGSCLVYGLALAALACGDDDDGPPDPMQDASTDSGTMDASQSGAGGGASGSGGGDSSGGGSGGSGGAGGMDAGDPYTCEPAQPPADPGGDADEGEACCDGLGVCRAGVSGPGTEAYGHEDCSAAADLTCVPRVPDGSEDGGIDDDAGSEPTLPTCRVSVGSSGADYEGRCIPTCFLIGSPGAAGLGPATCGEGNACVPCYSPITGESTGACNRPGDAPVDPAPAGFAECGEGNTGYCVPGTQTGSTMLPQLTCGDGEVCAPKSRVLDRNSCFARCESIVGPGACVPSFIVGSQASLLTQQTCMTGELCVPCINPLTGMSTNACN